MQTNRKIAFLCHPYHRGGVTRWMADAAIACAQQGHEVYFITVDPVKEFFSAKGRETLLQLLGKEKNTVKIISAPAGYEFEFGTPEYRAWVYKSLLLKLPEDIPVILSDDHAVWAAATFLQNACPVIGVMHADEGHYYNLAQHYANRVDVLACVSDRVKETTKKRVPAFDPARIYTIPCGINLPAPQYGERPDDSLQLVFVGRISEYQKRVSDLVKIAALLARKGIKFHLHIIGEGPDKTSLENKVKEEGLQQQVTFPGWLSQAAIARYLSAADVLLLTSDFEGTPIAMMEAFAAGCSVVGTRVSGIEDYEHHPLAGDCLRVYPVGAIEAAVDGIKQISAIAPIARRRAARKLVETEFSMEVCMERYFNAMNSISPCTGPVPSVKLSRQQLMYSKIIALARYIKVRVIVQRS